MEDSGGGEISSKKTAGVGEDSPGVEEAEHEEGDGPDAMEDLKRKSTLITSLSKDCVFVFDVKRILYF